MGYSAGGPDHEPVAAAVMTVVFSPACHSCDDAETALGELGESYPLVVDRVDIRSDRGLALVREHRSPMSPLVLLDGAFFSSGRLPRRKLVKLLEQRSADVSVAATGQGRGGLT